MLDGRYVLVLLVVACISGSRAVETEDGAYRQVGSRLYDPQEARFVGIYETSGLHVSADELHSQFQDDLFPKAKGSSCRVCRVVSCRWCDLTSIFVVVVVCSVVVCLVCCFARNDPNPIIIPSLLLSTNEQQRWKRFCSK